MEIVKNTHLTKKFSLLTLGVSGFALLLFGVSQPSQAQGAMTVTIRGNVNKVVPGPTLVGVAGQRVNVRCGGAAKHTTTDSNGLYTVTITDDDCTAGSTATAKSDYNASTITRQVGVSSEGRATIDLNF